MLFARKLDLNPKATKLIRLGQLHVIGLVELEGTTFALIWSLQDQRWYQSHAWMHMELKPNCLIMQSL